MIGRFVRDEVVARLPRLARDAGGDDEDVGALEVGPVRRAADVRVVAEDGAVLLEVERLALGEVLLRRDVEEEDVAELLVRAEARELAADVAGSDETDLLAGGHEAYLGHMCAMMLSPNSRALDLGRALHQAREVVGDASCCAIAPSMPLMTQVGGLGPAQVPEHHLAARG